MKTALVRCVTVAALLAPAVARAQSAAGNASVQGDVQVGAAVPVAPPPRASASSQSPVAVQPPPRYVQVQGPPPPGYMYVTAPPGPTRPVPYRGGPVPPGTHVEQRPAQALIITGAVVLGAAYLSSCLLSTLESSAAGSGWGYVPLLGPFVFAAQVAAAPRPASGGLFAYNPDPSLVASMVIDGIAQLVGGVLLVGGLSTHNAYLVPDAAIARRSTPRDARWTLAPGAPGAPLGASLSVLHF